MIPPSKEVRGTLRFPLANRSSAIQTINLCIPFDRISKECVIEQIARVLAPEIYEDNFDALSESVQISLMAVAERALATIEPTP